MFLHGFGQTVPDLGDRSSTFPAAVLGLLQLQSQPVKPLFTFGQIDLSCDDCFLTFLKSGLALSDIGFDLMNSRLHVSRFAFQLL